MLGNTAMDTYIKKPHRCSHNIKETYCSLKSTVCCEILRCFKYRRLCIEVKEIVRLGPFKLKYVEEVLNVNFTNIHFWKVHTSGEKWAVFSPPPRLPAPLRQKAPFISRGFLNFSSRNAPIFSPSELIVPIFPSGDSNC